VTANWIDDGDTSWLKVAFTVAVTATPVAPGAGLDEDTFGAGGTAAVVKLQLYGEAIV
jgi:hypothetical protein